MSKIWFKRKTYGWGWTPCTWEGWLSLLVFVLFLVWNFQRIDAVQHSGSDTLINFVPQTFFAAAALILLCFVKGERPRWQWGERSEKVKDQSKK